MRRFLRRKDAQQPEPEPSEESERPLPCIVEAVEKLAAEMDGAQDILGKLQRACEEEEAEAHQKAESTPAVPPSGPKPPTFRVGEHVVVSGLQTATQHNGKVGKMESFRCEAQSTRGLVVVPSHEVWCWFLP